MKTTKKIIGGGALLLAVIVFAGCKSNINSVKNQEQNEVAKSKTNFETKNNTVDSQEYIVDPSDNIQAHALIDGIKVEDLDEKEKAGLIQMREEEKLARDVYLTLYEKWGQNIFNNISKSEQTHTDTIKVLLDKYNIVDPVTNDKVGIFTAPEMQKLYNDLTAKGNISLVEALTVGAIIEDLDISDLNKLLAITDNEDIRIAYQNLNKGSRNHMRAFTRNLERNGGTYAPQYISQVEYDKIIAEQQERGSVNAKGNGQEGENHNRGGKNRGNINNR